MAPKFAMKVALANKLKATKKAANNKKKALKSVAVVKSGASGGQSKKQTGLMHETAQWIQEAEDSLVDPASKNNSGKGAVTLKKKPAGHQA